MQPQGGKKRLHLQLPAYLTELGYGEREKFLRAIDDGAPYDISPTWGYLLCATGESKHRLR